MGALIKRLIAVRRLILLAVLIAMLTLTACTTVSETDPTPTQITPDFPAEPPATFTPAPPTPEVQVVTVTPQETMMIPDTGEGLAAAGEEIFQEACAACHQPEGQGFAGVYPPLNGSGFVNADDPNPLISVIITGRGGMPTFHNILSSEEIAAVVTYIRGAWNNQSGPVDVEQVEQVWQETGLEMDEEEED
jgi:mono/diheme cytochrome c family protein